MRSVRYSPWFWLDAIALALPTIAFVFGLSFLTNGGWDRLRGFEPACDIGYPWHFYSIHQGSKWHSATAFWADVSVLLLGMVPAYRLMLVLAYRRFCRYLKRRGSSRDTY